MMMENTAYVLPNSGHSRDDQASKMGMWLFLFTELLLFGGLFLVYFVYRTMYPESFRQASAGLNVFIGTVNTIVLITSSLTVAMSITAMQRNNKKQALILLWLTIFAAGIFMVNKYIEWSGKFEHGLFPGMDHYNHLPHGEQQFYFLYFFMTGLHALHIIIGAVFLYVIIRFIKKGKIFSTRFVLQENGGLYWHLVDLIWIYLFPLFYLI
jgi:cytochrome c oxidase subunit 3